MVYVQALEQLKDAAGGGFIKITGGFVSQQQPGIPNQCPSQCHPLLLPA